MDNLQISYRQCFTTLSGRTVLTHLLLTAGVFDDDLKTSEEQAVENFAKGILHTMGIYNKDKPDHQRMVVDRVLDLPVFKEDKNG